MKPILKFAALAATAVVMYFTDISLQPTEMPFGVKFMTEAYAVAGVRRRAHRRGVAVGYSAGAEAAAASSAAAPPAEPAPQQTAAAPPPPVYGALPEGTVISVLPSGCAPVTTAGVQYQHCGENYFRAVFQGNNLVYVSATPG